MEMEKEILSILKSMQGEFKSMQSDMKSMQKNQKETNARLERVENKTDIIETQVKENTEILRTLRHNGEVHKAEIDKVNVLVAKEVGGLKKEVHDLGFKVETLGETHKSLSQVYGEHEIQIRNIKRKYS